MVSTASCSNAQALSARTASVQYPFLWCASSMLYPISALPFFGLPLKPALPTSSRWSRRTQYHKFQPAFSGPACSSADKNHFWEFPSFSGGGQLEGSGTFSSRANSLRLSISARASSTVPATSSRRSVNSLRFGILERTNSNLTHSGAGPQAPGSLSRAGLSLFACFLLYLFRNLLCRLAQQSEQQIDHQHHSNHNQHEQGWMGPEEVFGLIHDSLPEDDRQ